MSTENESVIAKCGHETKAIVSEEGEFLNVPDCCAMCEELIEADNEQR